MTIAQTILAQLGANRFAVMTGARDFSDTGRGLQFRLPRIAGNRIRFVRIDLGADDLYTVKFYDSNVRLVREVRGVYADALQSTFTAATGLDTHL